MKINYFGHSSFLIEAVGKRIVVDPFLTGNPLCPVLAASVECDTIVLTHGHADHTGDALELAQRNKAPIIAVYELANHYQALGVETVAMGVGGSAEFDFGRLIFTPALHSSSFVDGNGVAHYAGNPAGVVLQSEGTTLYHAGDTALFSDMKLIAERTPIDVALLPIGDYFTMGIDDAVRAVDFLKPKCVVPVHYNTFPPIETDPLVFKKKVEALGVDCVVLEPGQSMEA